MLHDTQVQEGWFTDQHKQEEAYGMAVKRQ